MKRSVLPSGDFYRAFAVVWWKGEWEFRREFPSRVQAEVFRQILKGSGRREVASSISSIPR